MIKMKQFAAIFAATAIAISPLSLCAVEWVVEEKTISVSSGLSKEVHAAMSAMGAPNLKERRSTQPKDKSEWRQFVTAMEGGMSISEKQLERTFGVQIEVGEISGVGVFTVTPPKIDPAFDNSVFVHLHGGGYLLGGGVNAAREAAGIASTGNIKVISIDYTLSLDGPFPAGMNDVIAVYNELLKSVPANNIAIGGTSAGGGLALAAVHRLKALKSPLPGALFAGTPWADLAATGDTIKTFEGIDNVLGTHDGFLDGAARLYAGRHDVTNPLISPLYGDFSHFPPTYLVSGTRDMLLSDTVRVHRRLREAGATADLNVFEGIPHGGYVMVPGSREFNGAYGGLGDFLKEHLLISQ